MLREGRCCDCGHTTKFGLRCDACHAKWMANPDRHVRGKNSGTCTRTGKAVTIVLVTDLPAIRTPLYGERLEAGFAMRD